MKENLNEKYWQSRYENQQTGWDIGYASPAILNYFRNVENKNAAILIPGAGNAYEAEALSALGFQKIDVLDIARAPLENAKNRIGESTINFIQSDFFQWEENYDFIVEQTFFCALDPSLRQNYVQKTHQLLNKRGKLVGLLFASEFEKQGPPFGGTQKEYLELFTPYFEIKKMTIAEDSIPERQGNEYFIELIKK